MSLAKYTGIIPPLVTPLLARDQLDIDGLERQVERLIRGGVGGLFLLGTTGEGPALSYRLRREFIERVCRQVALRVPVLVSISDTSYVESLAMGRFAADAGCDALVAVPPYYLPPSQPELRDWVCDLGRDTPIPLLIYNIPAITKVSLGAEVIAVALEHSNIIGLKDSSGDLDYFRSSLHLARSRPDWSVLIGPEELLAEATEAGGHGGVCGGANIFPELYVALHDAAARRKTGEAERLQFLVRQIAERLYGVGQHPSRIIKGIKGALSCLGVCDAFMAPPFRQFNSPERKRIADAVEEFSAAVAAALPASKSA